LHKVIIEIDVIGNKFTAALVERLVSYQLREAKKKYGYLGEITARVEP